MEKSIQPYILTVKSVRKSKWRDIMESWLTKFSRIMSGKVSRWVVIGCWVLLTAVLTFLWPAVNDKVIDNNQNLSKTADSVKAEEVIKKEFPNTSGIPALITWHNSANLNEEDLKIIQELSRELETNPLAEQASVPPLHQLPLPALMEMTSKDGTTLVQPIFFNENAETDVLKKNLEEIKKIVKEKSTNDPFSTNLKEEYTLTARATGPVGIQVDATDLFKDADVTLLIATFIIVLTLLLLIYRSPILAIIPLVGVGFTYGVVSPILGFMASNEWIEVDSQAIAIMTVLLFGAGTDYCLFLISYFRDELRHAKDKRTALIKAMTDSSGAIAMSGLTVVISLFALLLAKYGAYHRFAIPFSLSIFIMGIASITLIPALLSVLGRTSFYPFIPRTREMEKERAEKKGKVVRPQKETGTVGKWIGNFVTKKPWTVTIVCLVLFGSLAFVSTQIKYTYDLLSSFPKDMPSREGFNIISDAYSPGELAPVSVILDTDGKDVSLQKALDGYEMIANISAPENGKANTDIVKYNVIFLMNPYSTEAMKEIPVIRKKAEDALKEAGVEDVSSKVWVGGQTATQYDTMVTGDNDTKLIIPVIIGAIALLLVIYLRSITAMLYLIGTVVLSFAAALGLGWLILHYGFSADAIQGSIPLYAFVFLVALGEDYNIFMVSSIWKKRKVMPLKQAIQEGVRETSGVITSAGLILAATFAVLASLPIQVLVEFGLITALGILMDTFIVRPFLVPAITTILGRFAFWPGKTNLVKEKQLNS